MEQFAAAVCLTYEKNNIYSGGSSMDKQIEESEPKKQEKILSFGGVAISVKYAEQDDPHIAETLKRSVFSYCGRSGALPALQNPRFCQG